MAAAASSQFVSRGSPESQASCNDPQQNSADKRNGFGRTGQAAPKVRSGYTENREDDTKERRYPNRCVA